MTLSLVISYWTISFLRLQRPRVAETVPISCGLWNDVLDADDEDIFFFNETCFEIIRRHEMFIVLTILNIRKIFTESSMILSIDLIQKLVLLEKKTNG